MDYKSIMSLRATYPGYFRPQSTSDLVRIGAPHDGGYVIPERVLAESRGLLSFGLHDDCSFEAAFARHADCSVVCFDHTVDGKFWVARAVFSLAKAVLTLEPRQLGLVQRWLAYRRMFGRGRHRHIRKALGYGGVTSLTYAEAVRIAGFEGRYFAKIDIEGWEYRLLDDLVTDAGNLTGLAIELHDIDLHGNRIKRFLSDISGRMQLVHFHPNSSMCVGPNGTSIVVELTFLNRDLLMPGELLTYSNLPLKDRDAPNAPGGLQIQLRFD